MPKIFISYRREDTDFQAHSICKRLRQEFGVESIFIDVDTIPPGVDFRLHLSDSVSKCDVLLAIVGSSWLDARSENGERRLNDPRDFVRIEIEQALARNIPVIPVVFGQTRMPNVSDLPETLQNFAYRNAVFVREGRDFDIEVERLIQWLKPSSQTPTQIAQTVTAETMPPAAEPRQSDAVSKDDCVSATGDLTSSSPERPAESGARYLILRVSCICGTVVETKGNARGKTAKCPSCLSTLRFPFQIANSVAMKLALLPAGEFMMGSPDSDEMANDKEKPQHPVKLTKPFYLGVHTVTQADYEKLAGRNPSKHKGDSRRPVENVSWFDAVTFCNLLSDSENLQAFYEIKGESVTGIGGTGYRLPIEAEWEYACRAGTSSRWSFGDEESKLQEYAWYDDNSISQPHPVGEMKPNLWGLYDMHGNVWEWCWDCHARYNTANTTNPMGPLNGQSRVLRGGTFTGQPGHARSAHRSNHPPNFRSHSIGFRLARTYE